MEVLLEVYPEAPRFEAAVRGLLEAHEAENALMLGLLARGLPSPFMACATSAGAPVFAAFHGGFNLIVSRGTEQTVGASIDATIAALDAIGLDLPGVIGPVATAARFAQRWTEQHACHAAVAVEQRLHELEAGALSRPTGVPGHMRPLALTDLELGARWGQAFDHEALPPHEHRTLEATRERTAQRIEARELFAWEDAGALVAMAGLARPTRRTISVNSVYTPPEWRGRGFASALVAAISEEGLRRGKQSCVLYTDLANPTSNSIYRKLGYRPVGDWRNYKFRPRGEAGEPKTLAGA